MLRRLFHTHLQAGALRLDSDNSHYATHVLRLHVGDAVELFDGRGGVAQGRIVDTGNEVEVDCETKAVKSPRGPRVDLVLSPIKGPRADWAVEKLTEIGVAHIRWVRFARSVVTPSDDRLERWQRICQAAARQCGRNDLPTVHAPIALASFLESLFPSPPLNDDLRNREQSMGNALRLVAEPAAVPLRQVATRADHATLVIGPEGGLTAEELELLEAAGYTPVALGRWTLRAETAAVVGAGMLLGDA